MKKLDPGGTFAVTHQARGDPDEYNVQFTTRDGGLLLLCTRWTTTWSDYARFYCVRSKDATPERGRRGQAIRGARSAYIHRSVRLRARGRDMRTSVCVAHSGSVVRSNLGVSAWTRIDSDTSERCDQS